MINTLGVFSTQFSFITGLICLASLFIGRRNLKIKRFGVYAGLATSLGIVISSLLLLFSLATSNFAVEYVFEHTEQSLQLIYKISAFWSGGSGSILYWSLILSIINIIVYVKYKKSEIIEYVFKTNILLTTLFLVMVTFIKNPFAVTNVTSDGFGMNPALQSLGMVVHPPTIIVAYSLFLLIFAFVYFDYRKNTLTHTKEIWYLSIISWFLLTFGIITGGIWAYTELGWGGYWAWDAIENIALVVWLFLTAFLNNLRDIYLDHKIKKSSLTYIILTVITMLLGTFVVRSGALESVHGYNQNESVTLFLGGFIVLITIYGIDVLFRQNKFNFHKIQLKKEFFFKTNTYIIILAAVVLLATLAPLIEWLVGVEIKALPITFYEVVFSIISLTGVIATNYKKNKIHLIHLLIGISPFLFLLVFNDYSLLVNCGLGTAAFVTLTLVTSIVTDMTRFTYKKLVSRVLNLSIILLILGFTFTLGVNNEQSGVFGAGDSGKISNYSIKLIDVDQHEEASRTRYVANLEVLDGITTHQITSEYAYYEKLRMPHSQATIKSKIDEDLYIIFSDINEETQQIKLDVSVVKWISLLKLGLLLFIISILVKFSILYKD